MMAMDKFEDDDDRDHHCPHSDRHGDDGAQDVMMTAVVIMHVLIIVMTMGQNR